LVSEKAGRFGIQIAAGKQAAIAPTTSLSFHQLTQVKFVAAQSSISIDFAAKDQFGDGEIVG
jgi:hypothetical protein